MEITLEKTARVKKEEGAGFQSLKSKFQHRGGAFICFLVSVLLYGRLFGTIEVVAFYLPCVRFILFVICCAACLLIMRYRAF